MTLQQRTASAEVTAVLRRVPASLRPLVRDALALGARAVHGSRHLALIPPDPSAPVVRVSSTPSSRSATAAVRRDLRRAGLTRDSAHEADEPCADCTDEPLAGAS